MDQSSLRYPEFSVVFLQLFPLIDNGDPKQDKSKCFTTSTIISELPEEENIDSQIFRLSDKDKYLLRRYTLDGFNFELNLSEPYQLQFKGRAEVKMAFMINNIVSISYRFMFYKENINAPEHYDLATTDHIISLLATHLGAEHWSENDGDEEQGAKHTNINLQIKSFIISDLKLDENGDVREVGKYPLKAGLQIFDQISSRYRKHIYSLYNNINKKFKIADIDSMEELHYAMVDLWESIAHHSDDKPGENIFDNKASRRMTEAEIIEHIANEHKEELIGLMTLYPEEWRYRDSAAFHSACGGNIAIDTDDLVLANTNMAVVIGTYGRRGAESPTDWKEHLQERKIFNVSWPEYLAILEMILSKKYIVQLTKEKLIELMDLETDDTTAIINQNAELSIKITKMLLMMDIVKFSKFISHKIMHDRTVERLEYNNELESLNTLMNYIDNNLQNISDYRSAKSDHILNLMILILSVMSGFEVVFQEKVIPLFDKPEEGSLLAKSIIAVVLFIIIVGLFFIAYKYISLAMRFCYNKISIIFKSVSNKKQRKQ